jgi:hypothetical protein
MAKFALLMAYLCAPVTVVKAAAPRSLAFQNLIPSFGASPTKGAIALEDELIAEVSSGQDRLANSEKVSSLVTQLEQSGKSIARPAIAPQVMGRWRLLQTTNTDTSSPIQRKAVDTSRFPIYQDIALNEDGQLVVSQIVKFSETAELCVDALASTSQYPLPELTERKSTGKILGLNILGVSLVGEEAQPQDPDSRIDFVFDEGNLNFNGLRITYPVPFLLAILRDTVKGWIDITYLSDRLRISRGNKGTTFILAKEDS